MADLRQSLKYAAVLAVWLLCGAHRAIAGCDLSGSEVVAYAGQVTDRIYTLNDLAAGEIAEATGPLCENSFTRDAEITGKISNLLSCSGPQANAGASNDTRERNLALAKMFLSAAINFGLCADTLRFRLELLQRYAAGGVSNPGDDQRIDKMQSALKERLGLAERWGRNVRSLLPTDPGSDADALALLGALYMQPMLPMKDDNLAADYLFQAGAAYLNGGRRDQALKMLSGLDGFAGGKPLAEKLRARLYGGGNP